MSDVFTLPPTIAAAIMTERSELVGMWVAEEPETRTEIGKLLMKLLEDRATLRIEIDKLRERMRSAAGAVLATQRCVEVLNAVNNGAPADEVEMI